MECKHCCVVDAQGYYDLVNNPYVKVSSEKGDYSDAKIDDYLLKDGEYLVDAYPPYDMIAPQWNGTKWEDAATRRSGID